ncbi:xylose repressor [Pontibacillus halophilus JSM 076056 = DSM 19796]|uniref:Xylose repressor n=1 Tax=Pontibacillus halophilus JSM 076056 = DSM 19796 TaxID=1385510 RepID=A0A0A5GD86_9BACI|nr:ROK family transcriptional regulator [Pontibacillus halophilus]KGX89964.1 xylose repressor [Pontibacillus halophilus JSM 076056 = DSM 19796]
MSTGDASYIRVLNRRLLIEQIIEKGEISRIELSRLTGLNRSTVSAQVNRMLEEGLIVEKPSDVSNGGRKPILIRMNAESGFTLGIDIDAPVTLVQVTDLLGKPIQTYHLQSCSSNQETMDNILHEIDHIIETHSSQFTPHQLVGIGLGVHGIVDNEHKVVFTPKQSWAAPDIKQQMEDRYDVPVYIDNNANLSVYAEQVLQHPSENLLCVTMYSGIGLGILEDNTINRGTRGFAGEIGHMIVQRNGLPCPCGNKGCWERYASEKSLKRKVSALGIEDVNLNELKIEDLEEEYREAIDEYVDYVAVGLNNVINIFNPQTVIVNSEFIHHHPLLLKQVEERLTSRINDYEQLVSSSLGRQACSLGGAMIVLKDYYEVKTLDFSGYGYQY